MHRVKQVMLNLFLFFMKFIQPWFIPEKEDFPGFCWLGLTIFFSALPQYFGPTPTLHIHFFLFRITNILRCSVIIYKMKVLKSKIIKIFLKIKVLRLYGTVISLLLNFRVSCPFTGILWKAHIKKKKDSNSHRPEHESFNVLTKVGSMYVGLLWWFWHCKNE